MAFLMAHLTLAIATALICKASADPYGLASADGATVHAKLKNKYIEQFDDIIAFTALLQTDLTVSTKPVSAIIGGGMCNRTTYKEAEGTRGDVLTRTWQWVTQAPQLEESKNDAMEAAKRFHKDFIAAALIMTCVFPWSSHPGSPVDTAREGQSGLWHMLPSGQSLRVLLVLLLWLKHYWFKDQYALEIAFVLVGAVFDFVNQHAVCEDDMWQKLSEFVPDQFSRLYPFYTLYVIVCYLAFFSSPSYANETLFGGYIWLTATFSVGAWFLSVVFACYLVLPVLASPPEHIQSSAAVMICAGCVAMVILPRTLAAPVHSPWVWSEDQASLVHSNPDGVVYELFFARRSLLLGLAHFFFGLVLARAGLANKLRGLFLAAVESDASKERQCTGRRELDLWKAFEDEAKRDMMSSLSIHQSDHMNHGYYMSPRSDHSD